MHCRQPPLQCANEVSSSPLLPPHVCSHPIQWPTLPLTPLAHHAPVVRTPRHAGVYLLKHWMLNQHDRYWRSLRHIIGTAQQLNDERLLDNPYLQMRTMLNVDHA
jgi:hypothetical protein